MTESHRLALEKLRNLDIDNSDVIALIICGSLACGKERSDSDVDCYLVHTDDAFGEVKRKKTFFYGTWNPEEFFGVSIDGKIVSMDFLRKAVTDASEPTRASFIDAYALFSRNPDIDSLIRQIAVYPDHDQFRRARAFYSYVKITVMSGKRRTPSGMISGIATVSSNLSSLPVALYLHTTGACSPVIRLCIASLRSVPRYPISSSNGRRTCYSRFHLMR